MDNHGKPKQIIDFIVHNIAKYLNFDKVQLYNNLEQSINKSLKKRKEVSKNHKKRKERNSTHKAFYYSWTCYCSLRTFLTSFTLGDIEHPRTILGILVSFVILNSYGSILLGGEIFD